MMLPDELEWVLEMLGFTWPTADEDKLVQSAEVWEKFASDVAELHANANSSASTVLANNAGDAVDKFKKTYDKFDNGGDGYLQNASQAATVIGMALRGAAILVVSCKVAVIVQLIALAVQIIAAAAASVVTFGLSNAASLATTAITRVTVRQILDTLKDALIEAAIECMKEPAVSALEAMITDLTRQSVNVGFGAQSGIDISETVKAGAEGGWEAIKQTPQTFLESVRDSVGSKAGGAARRGAENFADSGPLGSNPSSMSAEAGTGPESASDATDPASDTASDSDSSSDGPSVSSTVSADTGGDGPDLGDGPGSDSPSNSDGPSLGDFNDGSDNSPSSGQNSNSDSGGNGGPSNSNPGGITSPNAQSGPTPSASDSSPSSKDGPNIGTQVNSLASSAPTVTNSAPPPTTSDSSPSRGDSNNAMPTSPNSPSTGDSGSRNSPSQGGSSQSGGNTATSPNPSNSAPPRNNPSANPGTQTPGGTPSSPNPSNPGPGTTPRPTPGDGSSGTPGGRPSVPQQNTPGGAATPVHTPGGNSPGGNSPGGNSPGGNPPQHSPGNPGTPNAPSNPATPNTPPQAPANNPPQQATPGPVVVPVHTVTTTATPQTPDLSNQSNQSNQSPGAHNDNGNNKDDDSKSEPTPASSTRDNTPPGGVNDPSRREQNALENSVPRDENGDPTRPPNPDDGNWVERINGNGTDTPGRSNNCVDTALSTVDTFAGTPTAAGARTPDLDADGNPSDRGERGGRDRIENTLGARFNDMGNGRDAYNRLENTLRKGGHGSQAVIITQDANGRAHAWNAVNHNGKITYIDAQSGQRSPNPLHSGKNGVFAIPLGADRRPVTPGNDNRSRNDSGQRPEANSPARSDRSSPERPADTQRRPNAEPAGAKPDDSNSKDKGKDNKGKDPDPENNKDSDKPEYSEPHDRGDSTTSDESRRVTEGGPDNGLSRTHEQAEDSDSKEYGIEADDLQKALRDQRDVHRVELDRVHSELDRWAGSGDLNRALQQTAPGSGDGPRTFTRNELSTALPGFGQLSRGEQQAVVTSLARLSLSFHQQHSVGVNPERIDRPYRAANEGAPGADTPDRGAKLSKQSLGVRLHRMAINQLFKVAAYKNLEADDAAKIKRHGPDFSGKNFAVLEIQGPPPKGEVTYVVESSVPANKELRGVQPRHSERHLLEWLKRVDPDGDKYTPLGLYTEREPCGTGQGHMKCSDVLLDERFKDVPIHYSTTYRDDPKGVDQRDQLIDDKKEFLKELKGLPDDKIKEKMAERLQEHYKDDPQRLERTAKRIDGKSGAELLKSIRNELDTQRKETRTPKEQAITKEFDQHIDALQETWNKLRPQLTA
ncbi:toxin glutamine deamidase domain-containing protein [Streptomyces boluensis]|nr:toxin glutamine deamidase domain-containing protein [Streptomyces boluensis]